MRQAVYAFSVLVALYHLIGPGMWGVVLDPHLIVHLCAVLALSFVVFSGPGKGTLALSRGDIVLVAACVAVGVYFLGSVDALIQRALVVTPLSTSDTVAAGILLVLLLEGARRAVGVPFVAIMGCFLLLMYAGPYLPGMWSHPGMDVAEILDVTVWSRLQGIWGIPLRMSATRITLFLIFGKLTQHSGLGELFTSVVQALAGGARGGPAKVAVIGSALAGSFTAGPVANMVMTGSMTIPMMKQAGYKPHFAAAGRGRGLDRRGHRSAGHDRHRLHHGGADGHALRAHYAARHHPGGSVLRLPHPPGPLSGAEDGDAGHWPGQGRGEGAAEAA
jgi:TRAP-type uncharacterized transport system fused permease subunit